LQQGLPILETDPVDPKLDGAFILLGCGIPVAEAAGVGILDLLGPGILEAVAPGSVSALDGDGSGAVGPHFDSILMRRQMSFLFYGR